MAVVFTILGLLVAETGGLGGLGGCASLPKLANAVVKGAL
jgi:hypothetical protein